MTPNAISARGLINLEFKDIQYSNKNDKYLPIHYKDFVEDMINNRKSELYARVTLKRSGSKDISDSTWVQKSSQLGLRERNPEYTEVSTHPSQENHLENSDEIVTESQTSKAKLSRKRTSTSSKNPKSTIIKNIYSNSKRLKQLVWVVQDSASYQDEVKS